MNMHESPERGKGEDRSVRVVVPRITRYAIALDAHEDVEVVEAKGIAKGGKPITRWAIRKGSDVWTRDRDGWCVEPMPSSRDEAWYALARWATPHEALDEVADHVIPWEQARRARRAR